MGTLVDLDSITVYRAEPDAAPRRALILIHEIWGLVPHITGIADRFAAEGYLVLAPDLLSSAGITPEVGLALNAAMVEPDEAKRLAAQPVLRERLAPARAPEFAEPAVARLRRLVDALELEPGIDGRIGVAGFCFGGTYSFALAAADSRVRAAVPFYGSAPAAERIAGIEAAVFAIYGEHDPALMARLPEVRTEMQAAGVRFTDLVYPDAGHAFFNDTNPIAYRPDAAADAWRRALAFLDEELG